MPELEAEPGAVFSDLEVTENQKYEPAEAVLEPGRGELEWSKHETAGSIPYYLVLSPDQRGRPVARTSWLHPDLSRLVDSFPGAGVRIKYAAYRAAFKLRSLQLLTRLSALQLHSLCQSLTQHNYLAGTAPCFLAPADLEALLATAFSKANFSGTEGARASMVSYATELTLNFLLSCYDPGRTGAISLAAVKTALVALSVAPLPDKYRYLFQLATDRQSPQTLDRERAVQLLADLMRITAFLEESLVFGDNAIGPCYQSLLQETGGQDSPEFSLSLHEFTQWALLEPQSLVWIPTLHRLAAVEGVKHSVKCGICRAYPLQGFNFRCQRCANMNICQSCFFAQRSSSSHKLTHPVREYALPTTSKEDLKDMLRVARNKFSLSHYRRSKRKQSYLPQEGGAAPLFRSAAAPGAKQLHASIRLLAARLREIDGGGRVSERVQEGTPVSMLTPEGGRDENRKLRERLDKLEGRNRELQSLLDPSRYLSEEGTRDRDSLLEDSYKVSAGPGRDLGGLGRLHRSLQQERMEVRVEVLEHHNKTLEQQLFDLRRSLVPGETEGPPSPDTSNGAKQRKFSDEEGLFALVSRILADPVTSRHRRLTPGVTEAVSSLGQSLSSMVLELKVNAS